MSMFQKVVIALLALIACVIFIGIGGILMMMTPTSSQVSTPAIAEPVENTPIPLTATPDSFTVTENSLGSKKALEKEITSKGWEFLKVETMSDGIRCDTYESSHVIFGLCAEGDALKAIVIRGDASADFNPVFAIASMYSLNYPGGLNDKVTDVWLDLAFGQSETLDVDKGVLMTIQRTYDDGYGITYILGSHID